MEPLGRSIQKSNGEEDVSCSDLSERDGDVLRRNPGASYRQ